ncbi:MAG: hypothetical protein K5641_02045 [Lachnospiraceae bacterium]|nr:hypothetical protein [Lachnospiraceae bacterium]
MQQRGYGIRISFSTYARNGNPPEEIADALVAEALFESDDPTGGDYLRYQYGGYRLHYSTANEGSKVRYTLRIIPSYYTTAAQERAVDGAVKEIIGSLGLNADASDYDKTRAVATYLCDTVDYDTVHKHTPGSRHIQSTAYGALLSHTALCQGYAVACYRLLKELSVDTRIITGDMVLRGKNERHAWNIVRIGGRYYNLDVTLMDSDGTLAYFLKSDEAFAADHERDEKYRTDEFYREYPMSSESYSDE